MKLKIAKLIAGGIGWALAGPVGGFLGFIVGALIDEHQNVLKLGSSETQSNWEQKRTYAGDFNVSLAILSAAVMKADGKVLKSELNYVKSHLNKTVGSEAAVELLQVIKESIKRDIPIRAICEQLRSEMNYPERVLLLQYLFGISKADDHVDQSEVNIIHLISRYLRISISDYKRLSSIYGSSSGYSSSKGSQSGQSKSKSHQSKSTRSKSKADPYTILGISRTAAEVEIKKAYRSLVKKYHPDKVAHLGEVHQKNAKERFQLIQTAYEKICDQK
ncbi:MAG: DnaJ domain-containing protein, partial [Flavobacteriales bacterium]|nr:DnaJ domain-containing protein [Flavobacteriales bacterium]